ncbi:MAG: phage N-6-adenine-methyltransferase [Prevotella sp.]|nr:phage N-6-adenine-methyltransferase [Prevotella sp.]
MLNSGLFSSNTNEWATPQAFFNELNEEFHFTLDPCATPKNAKCSRYFTKEEDGLAQSWQGETVFCNPPYGRDISKWVKKPHEEAQGGAIVVMLITARNDTAYFHEYIYGKHEIRFVRGRLHFNESKQSAPFPSMVVVMRPTEKLFTE